MYNLPYTNKQINIPYLLKIGNGKICKIGKYLKDKNLPGVALFLGDGTEELVGAELRRGFGDNGINVVHSQVVSDISIESITQTAFQLPPATDVVVGIGGGKALDFAKYSAHLLRLPFVSVPTSTSNDGFCSPTSSLTVGGRRKTVKSSIPFGVVIDLDIIRNSPPVFFYSGLGDMVSKITALSDWKEAANRKLERYSDFASMLAYNSLDLLFIKHSFEIKAPEFQRSLITSLLMSGISMEVAGTSRPASGSEHLVSHALDEVCARPQMHGLQVGTAAYLCALLQNNLSTGGLRDILVKTGFFDFVGQNPFKKEEFLRALRLAPEIKRGFYTVLSEPDSYKRAVEFIDGDEILRELIK